MIRRLISAVAAIALVYAMAAPSVAACETRTAAMVAVGSVTEGSGEGHSAHESNCPESAAPASQEHDSDCLATCVSMMGCSASGFVVETAQLSVTDQASPVPASSTQLLPSRSLAPDRPPPRS
jgi:hypothetical protein